MRRGWVHLFSFGALPFVIHETDLAQLRSLHATGQTRWECLTTRAYSSPTKFTHGVVADTFPCHAVFALPTPSLTLRMPNVHFYSCLLCDYAFVGRSKKMSTSSPSINKGQSSSLITPLLLSLQMKIRQRRTNQLQPRRSCMLLLRLLPTPQNGTSPKH